MRTSCCLGAGEDVWFGVAGKKELYPTPQQFWAPAGYSAMHGHLGVRAVAGLKVHALRSGVWTTPQTALHSSTHCQSGHNMFQAFHLLPFTAEADALENGHWWNATSAGTCICHDSDLCFVAKSSSICPFWPTFETTFGIPTSRQLKTLQGLWVKPFTFRVSSSMTSRLFAVVLAYDRGSAWWSIISGCPMRKKSHHPLGTSTWDHESWQSAEQLPGHHCVTWHIQWMHTQQEIHWDLPLPHQ